MTRSSAQVRLLPGERHAEVCELFIGIFRREGCRLIEMSCEEHDAHVRDPRHPLAGWLAAAPVLPTPPRARPRLLLS